MKRKLFLGSAVIPALLATGATAQVVNFHDANNNFPIQSAVGIPGGAYCELFAGQGAYTDRGNDIWNGFGDYNTAAYGSPSPSTYFYTAGPGGPGAGGNWEQQGGNPGNPYSAYNSSKGWVTSTGTNLFDASNASLTTSGNSASDGQWTPITLSLGSGYAGDTGNPAGAGNLVQNGSPAFLLLEAAYNNGSNPDEVYTLQNVPAGTYGLYLYAANYNNNRGTLFSVNSGTAHNGIAATLNGNNTGGIPANSFVEGQNLVIFENVTPDASNNITITGSPNSADGVGNGNLTNETDVNGIQLIFNPPPTALGMTSAQNVYVGDMARFSFTPVFAAGASFHWQSVIVGVTNVLSDNAAISGSGTTNLTLTGVTSGNIGLYQCVITTATATNTTAAAPLTILSSTARAPLQIGGTTSAVGYILQPGDSLTDSGNTEASVFNAVPPPFNMGADKVVDGTLAQYINSGAGNNVAPFVGPVSFTVSPRVGASVVTGLRFFTSSRHPEDDPADFLLEGSVDGVTFTPIVGGLLGLPAQRNAADGAINITNQVLKELDFANTTPYSTYELVFTNVNDNDTASNGVQIAEIQFLGSLAALPPGIAQQPNPDELLLAGATYQPSVVANGPGPITYAWYVGTTAITNATNATLVITNIGSGDAGSYKCVITNPYGSTNSATVNLSVATPTDYEKELIALNPEAYWPLDETSGTVAYDTVGGYNATYNGGVTLAQPGVPFLGFGGSSLSALFDGTSGYVDIPEGPFNILGSLTVMAWENITSHGNFAGVFGHGDPGWRMSNNGSGQPGASDGGAGDATSGTSIIDGNWHLVAYTYTGVLGAANNGVLYVDGVQVATDQVNSTPAGDNLDVWIGGSPDYGTGRLVPGSIAHAAIFTTALTSNQIQALYFASAPAPTVTAPASVTVDLNGNVSIQAAAVGKPPIDYQWFEVVSGVTNLITGATNSALSLTDVQAVQTGYQYLVEVSNAFGVFTSTPVTVNVLSGQPSLVADIFPLLVEAPAGNPVTYTVGVTGTEPFAYQWSDSSGPIAGATDSDYTFNIVGGSNNYTVTVSNSVGSIVSSTAVVIGLTNALPVVNFAGNGANWTLNQGPGWPGMTTDPNITNDVLTLTDGVNSEACSAFFDTPQYIGGFIASFVYVAEGGADGTTFCIENSTNATFGTGVNAVGNGGGDLAFNGITPSAALMLNIYSGDGGGSGFLLSVDGNTPDTDAAVGDFINPSPVVISGGDPIWIQIYYIQNVAHLWFVDTKTGSEFSASYSWPDLPAVVGAPSALVGFTSATGGVNSTQTVSDFQFSSTTPPVLSVSRGAGDTVVVSWPITVSSLFALQQSGAINGPWENVALAPTVINGENTVTLPGPSTVFFRLSFE